MAKLKIQKTYTGAAGYQQGATINVDQYVSPTTINGNYIGGTGGNTDQTVPTIQCSFLRDAGGAVDTGYIIFQKGMRKFEVNNTSEANTTVATLVNQISSELTTANTMTILVTTAAITGANVANVGNIANTSIGGSYTNQNVAYVTWTSGNLTGYSATPTVGYNITGTSITGNVVVIAVNSDTNVTVATDTLQDIAAEQADISQTFNASRITNKFVYDWANPSNKYRYWLNAPYSDGQAVLNSQPSWQGVDFVQVDNA